MFIVNDAVSVKYPPAIIPTALYVIIKNTANPLKIYAEGVNCYSTYKDETHIGLYTEQNIRGINVCGVI